jgi:hypothetical protein
MGWGSAVYLWLRTGFDQLGVTAGPINIPDTRNTAENEFFA